MKKCTVFEDDKLMTALLPAFSSGAMLDDDADRLQPNSPLAFYSNHLRHERDRFLAAAMPKPESTK